MRRLCVAAVAVFLLPFAIDAATPDPSASLGTINAKVTCYAPGAGGKVEGPWATSRPAPNGGGATPKTLDDFRLGKSNFVTLAANPMHYKKWYNMGTVTYVSNLDNRRYTMTNVVGYVHDTGCAFRSSSEKGSCCARYNTCNDATRKFDIAYGDYRSGGNVGLVNSQTLCANREARWTQIGGPLSSAPTVSGGEQVTSGSALSSLSNSNQIPSSLSQLFQPQQPSAQQGGTPQQSGSVQPGQYFSNAYSPIPANQPFPYTSQTSNGNTNSNTGGSVASSLLDLIKPVTYTPAAPQVSLSSATSGTVVTIQPQGGTQVVSANPPTDTRLNPSQTFVQASLSTEQQGTTFDTAVLSRMLETLKSALLRILEIVRLR